MANKKDIFEKVGEKQNIDRVLRLIAVHASKGEASFIKHIPTAPVMDMSKRPKDVDVNTEAFLQRCRIGIMGLFGGHARRAGFQASLSELFDEHKNVACAASFLTYLLEKHSVRNAVSLYFDGVIKVQNKEREKLITEIEGILLDTVDEKEGKQ